MAGDVKKKAAKMLTFDEGIRFKPYHCPAGKLTIGIGHNIDANGLPTHIAEELARDGSISSASCHELFDIDLRLARVDAHEIFGQFWDTIPEARQLAILNMLFAMGRTRFLKWHNTIRYISEGRWAEAANNVLNSLWCREQAPKRARRVALLLRLEDGLEEPLPNGFDDLRVYL